MLNKELLCHTSGAVPTAVFELTVARWDMKDDGGYGYGPLWDLVNGYPQYVGMVGKVVPDSYKGQSFGCFGDYFKPGMYASFWASPWPVEDSGKTGYVLRTDTGKTLPVSRDKNGALSYINTGFDYTHYFFSEADVGKTITIEIYLK